MNTKKYMQNEIDAVINDLHQGLIVAFPTDTVFGLACIYDNEEAIKKVKVAKGRSETKPLPMMCSSIAMVERVAYLDDKAKKLFEKFAPGPITLVLKKRSNVEDYVTNGRDTIAIRIPNNDFIIQVINSLDKPLLVTSANLSDEPSLKRYEDVYMKLNGRIDALVCKDAHSDIASTIVDAVNDFKLLRVGIISEEDIREVIK